MRRIPAVLLGVFILSGVLLAPGCVNVHRGSSRPEDRGVVTVGGSPLVITSFTSTVTSSVTRVTNISYFDMAACVTPPPLVKDVFSDEQLMATLATARAQVLECLVPPEHRGSGPQTRAVATVLARPGAGLELTVGGENLTQPGERCVLKAVAAALANLPPLPAGWPPAGAQVEFVHGLDVLPGVKRGVNDLSDAAGQIRLAMPSFCPCFEPWRDSVPREIEIVVNLRKKVRILSPAENEPDSMQPTRVYLPGDLAARDARVAACLQERVQQMSFRVPRLEADVPYYFQVIDSNRDGPLPGLPAWLQHKQMEGVRNRRFAEMAVALGARSSAARNYDALVRRYQQNNKSIKVDALTRACQGLLTTDDAWVDAVRRKLEAERLALLTAEEMEPGHTERLAEQIARTEQSLTSASEVRKVDQGACPRIVKGLGPPLSAPVPIQLTPFMP